MRAFVALLCCISIAAHADETPTNAKLRGRVFERGTITPLAGADLQTSAGASTSTDAEGRFELDLPAGDVTIRIAAEHHDPLRVTEHLVAGQGLNVEYRLVALPGYRRRYETVVRGEARHEGDRFSLRGEELSKIAGSLGDPFRAVSLLPGVSTPLPALPLYVVRGASPGMNGFFLDGMRVPQLFHFLLLGGVVHADLIDRLDFYPGAYDASFGHYAGGIIDAETRAARSDATHGEAELRLYDASALAEAKLPGGILVEAGGHYGYPGPLVHLASPDIDVNYWDYQLRADFRGLTLEVLGSYDAITLGPNILGIGSTRNVISKLDQSLMLTFHRVQLRDRIRRGRFELEAAIVGGVDEMSVFSGQGVRKLGLGAHVNTKLHLGWLTLAAGVDGELSSFNGENFGTDQNGAAPDELGELRGDRDGVVGGAYLQGTLALLDHRLQITGGARVDVYHASPVTLVGIDPRATLHFKLMNGLYATGGFGYYQQPPTFPVALPGIDTFALRLGLQHAWQGAGGIEADLPFGFSMSLKGFFERFTNINDVVLDLGPTICTSPPPESLSGLLAVAARQVDGDAFGMELLLRRQIGRVSGWVAYTLSRAERSYTCGLRPADFDQTHVLNVVVQVRLPWRLLAGARFYVATGRPFTHLTADTNLDAPILRNNDRIPTFYQLDLRVDREWYFQKWTLALFAEVVNATYSKSIFTVQYPMQSGITRYDQPQFQGAPVILPSLGVRGKF